MEGKEMEPEVETKTIKVEPGENHAEEKDSQPEPDPELEDGNDTDPDPDPGEGPSSLLRDPQAGASELEPGPSHEILEEDGSDRDSDEDEDEEEEDEEEGDANLPLVVWEQPLKVGKEEPMDYDDDCMPGPSRAKPLHNWDSDSSDSNSESSTTSCPIRALPPPQDDEEEGDQAKKDVPATDAPAPADDMTLVLPESIELQPFGRVSGIIEKLVIIESVTDLPPVCEDSVIFKSNRHAAGKIFEIFGPIAHPFYVLRFSCLEHIKRKDIKIGDIMYFAPSFQHFTRYIFTDRIRDRGSDASWKNDLEPPPEAVDFSDDEKEKAAKNKKKVCGCNRKKQRSKSRSSYSRDGRKGFREPGQLALQDRKEDWQEQGQEEKQEETKQEESKQEEPKQEFGQEFGGQDYGQLEFGQLEYGQQEYVQQEYQKYQEYRPAAAAAAAADAAAAAAAAAEYHQEYRPVAEYCQEYQPDYQNLGAYGEAAAAAHWCPQAREGGRSCYNKREYHREFSRGHSRSQAAAQYYNADHRVNQNAPPSLFAPQHRQYNSLMQHPYQLAPQYFDMHHYQAHPSQYVAWSGLSQHVHDAHYQHYQAPHARGGGHCSQYRSYY